MSEHNVDERVCLTRCPLPPAEENVHSLPCHIHHDGAAAVKVYFCPKKDVNGSSESKESYSAEFRGIKLAGQRVQLRDHNYMGLIVEDSGMTHTDDEGKIWEVENHFDEIMWWCVPQLEKKCMEIDLKQAH
ncbi:TPA: hypothetical protein N0F65_002202 [Lagenidium giganteum]|uniref:Uncharacterized protein n=1 Tax=Lagenidium giganteum TaxID=4803 RepID=A0AAV2YHT5_9STRA|nr:TPA: hypothetical protein N0F65_002202 [Lagenidium giganteum]